MTTQQGTSMKSSSKKQSTPPKGNGTVATPKVLERDRTDRFDKVGATRSIMAKAMDLLPEQYEGVKPVTEFITRPGSDDHDAHEVVVFESKGPKDGLYDILVIQQSKAHNVRKLIHWSRGTGHRDAFIELAKLLSEKR